MLDTRGCDDIKQTRTFSCTTTDRRHLCHFSTSLWVKEPCRRLERILLVRKILRGVPKVIILFLVTLMYVDGIVDELQNYDRSWRVKKLKDVHQVINDLSDGQEQGATKETGFPQGSPRDETCTLNKSFRDLSGSMTGRVYFFSS